jgi:ketosteroid isomerase-like protein
LFSGSGMSAEIAIRLRRAEFNRAIAAADLAAIRGLLSPDVVMITGTDSAVLSGRKAQLLAWKHELSSTQPVIYTRITDHIALAGLEPIAMEHGQWRGASSCEATPATFGTYAAKWRKVDGEWVLLAEIFVTMG